MKAFKSLPNRFTHKDAKLIYGKGSQATTDFLHKCKSAGLLEKIGKLYAKTETGKA
jgi:hypothetical protein